MKNNIIEILKRHGAKTIVPGERAVFASFPASARTPLREAKVEIKNLSGVRKCIVSDFNKLGLGKVRVCIVHF